MTTIHVGTGELQVLDDDGRRWIPINVSPPCQWGARAPEEIMAELRRMAGTMPDFGGYLDLVPDMVAANRSAARTEAVRHYYPELFERVTQAGQLRPARRTPAPAKPSRKFKGSKAAKRASRRRWK